MTTKITVALEDDLEGGPADETMRFAVGGTQYEIDLNKKNARAFRKQLAPFVEHARRAGRGQRRPRTSSSRQRGGDIRAWAKEQGIAVSGRGRIPASVVAGIRRRDRGILTDLGDPGGAGLPRHRLWRRLRLSCYRADAAAGRLACLPPGRPATGGEQLRGNLGDDG
jgi:hypothetical protein